MPTQFGNYVFTLSFIDAIALVILGVIVYYLHFKHMFPLTTTAITTVVAAVLLGFGLVVWAKKYAPSYGLTESQGLFPVDYFFLEIILGIVVFGALVYYMMKDVTRAQNIYLYFIGASILVGSVAFFWARDEASSYGVASTDVWKVQRMI